MHRLTRILTLGSFCGMLLLPLPSSVSALSKTFSWTPPTTNTDGSPAVVDGYRMYRSSDGGLTYTPLAPTVVAPPFTDSNVPVGNVCYQVTAWNSKGESAHSSSVCFRVSSAVPNPPTGVQVTGSLARIAPSHLKKR